MTAGVAVRDNMWSCFLCKPSDLFDYCSQSSPFDPPDYTPAPPPLQLLVQLAAHLGAHVIGTTSSEAKAEIARAAGAHDVILYTQQVGGGSGCRRLVCERVHVVLHALQGRGSLVPSAYKGANS